MLYGILLGLSWCLFGIIPLGYCLTEMQNDSSLVHVENDSVFGACFLMSKMAQRTAKLLPWEVQREIVGRGV